MQGNSRMLGSIEARSKERKMRLRKEVRMLERKKANCLANPEVRMPESEERQFKQVGRQKVMQDN